MYDGLKRGLDWSRVDKTESCWLWTGSIGSHGYGQIHREGTTKLAHRVAYEELVAEIPKGLVIDHACSVKQCVNPDHLQVVTHKRNIQLAFERGEKPSPTHCKHGHDFTPENTYVYAGRRHCRACMSRRTVVWQRKARAARR